MPRRTCRSSGGDRLVTSDLAAIAAGVSREVIRQWVRRGHLTRRGYEARMLVVSAAEVADIVEARIRGQPLPLVRQPDDVPTVS